VTPLDKIGIFSTTFFQPTFKNEIKARQWVLLEVFPKIFSSCIGPMAGDLLTCTCTNFGIRIAITFGTIALNKKDFEISHPAKTNYISSILCAAFVRNT